MALSDSVDTLLANKGKEYLKNSKQNTTMCQTNSQTLPSGLHTGAHPIRHML